MTNSSIEEIKYNTPINYEPFDPIKWKEKNYSTVMTPWEGKNVVLLTTTQNFDYVILARFIGRLSMGWKLYENLVGKSPNPHRQYNNKVIIAAIPDDNLTCGKGCGWIGFTGIEVCGFYNEDYILFSNQVNAFPHYYFYEMGRNYFVFSEKHSIFTTGFAVFMRYVCMDYLKLDDPELELRKFIESTESKIKFLEYNFLQIFTDKAGLLEKQNRLNEQRFSSDQNVMYASVMLKLRQDYGGNDWVKHFFHYLSLCPYASPTTEEGVFIQCMNWLVSASCAARQNLSQLFTERWKMHIDANNLKVLNEFDWTSTDLQPSLVIDLLQFR